MKNLTRHKMLFAVLIYVTKKRLPISDKQRIFINQERGQLMANETSLENGEPVPYPFPYEHENEIKIYIEFLLIKLENDDSFHKEILDQINDVLI